MLANMRVFAFFLLCIAKLPFATASKNDGGVLFPLLLEKQKQLAEHAFLKSFTKENGLGFNETMAFAPHLFVFVIGFREVLHYVDQPESSDPVQLGVNNHAKEDGNHYLLLLHDLASLDLPTDYTGGSRAEMFEGFYGPASRPAHDLVYLLISSAMRMTSPVQRAALLEILESTYPVFASACSKFVAHHDLYDELQFFGRKHVEAEMAHAFGSWFDKKKVWKHESKLSSDELSYIVNLVDSIYDGFSKMFTSFHETQLKAAKELNYFTEIAPTDSQVPAGWFSWFASK